MADYYKFPIAPHSYFRALNKEQARADFLISNDSQPNFIYHNQFDPKVINERLQIIGDDTRARQLLEFVKDAALLQQDRANLEIYRKKNEQLFGKPIKDYTLAILNAVSRRVTNYTLGYWDEIVQITGKISHAKNLLAPSEDMFNTYKNYFEKYASISGYVGRDVIGILQSQLEATGLSKEGWKVRILLDNASHARTHQRAKTISIGDNYRPRSDVAATRIAVHEVYGHALRGARTSSEEGEGFAILLEQLLASRFKYRRSYRYLAVSLGWGVLGTPMTFRDVFEILWRVMIISSGYTVEDAKNYAFDECYRAFRGGRPDIAGAVYLKDSIYFRSNLAMWRILERRDIGYDKFVDIINGRTELLS